MIILIDNYDSFTYNLVQYLGDLGANVLVHRNNQITTDEVIRQKPRGVMISPGPSDPDHAGICLNLISACARHDIPLMGVCLGHQAIGQVFGGEVVRAPTPMHGKISTIHHTGQSVFKNIPPAFAATRYHSLVVEKKTFPSDLIITAETEDGLIMGSMHRTKPIHGVQFHPESIATEHGHMMIKNFLDLT
ncbi:MAG: aminodeoxychorismate/anthranilate synthase component II [Alphaproteobacteria bacterium]|nr:aminodeoxychorismate/anthranilate synthase component II [Alphaproteobacteria bacterium]